MRISCKLCKKLREGQINILQVISLKTFENDLLSTNKSLRHLIESLENVEIYYSFDDDSKLLIKSFSKLFFKNEKDNSQKTYLNIMNLFSKFKQYPNYSKEDILLTCFFLVMRSKYIIDSTNICFEDIRLHYKLNKDRISKLLELELIIFSIVGFRIPEDLFIDLIISLSEWYFSLIRILYKKKGIPQIRRKTECLFKNCLVQLTIKFYIYLIEQHFFNCYKNIKILYFSVFYCVFEKLNEYDSENHNNFTAFYTIIEELGIKFDFNVNHLKPMMDCFWNEF